MIRYVLQFPSPDMRGFCRFGERRPFYEHRRFHFEFVRETDISPCPRHLRQKYPAPGHPQRGIFAVTEHSGIPDVEIRPCPLRAVMDLPLLSAVRTFGRCFGPLRYTNIDTFRCCFHPLNEPRFSESQSVANVPLASEPDMFVHRYMRIDHILISAGFLGEAVF